MSRNNDQDNGGKQKNVGPKEQVREEQNEESPVKEENACAEIDKLRQEAADYKDRYIRVCADFDNARKRMERDRVEFVKYANEKLMSEFLGVLDNLERTVAVAEAKHQDYDAFLKGVEMVMKELKGMLKRNGLQPIEAQGKVFDPHSHEILAIEEKEGAEDNIVLEELQKGYYLGDKVLRTAKVKLAKKKEP
jgi:molecular chaperone GrpE